MDLDQGLTTSLRRLLFDLREEYRRHTGHADLLSEAAGERVGEDPPPGEEPVGAVEHGDGLRAPVVRLEGRRLVGARLDHVDLTRAELRHVDFTEAASVQ